MGVDILFMMINPVKGFSIVKTNDYIRDCRSYGNMMKRILNTELKIVGWPEWSKLLHEPLKSSKCLHACVDQNMRILYRPDYKKKLIVLTSLLTHRELDRI